MMDLHESWINNKEYLKSEFLDDTFRNGAEVFRDKAIHALRMMEDPLYVDDNETTPKELLWEIIQVMKELKL